MNRDLNLGLIAGAGAVVGRDRLLGSGRPREAGGPRKVVRGPVSGELGLSTRLRPNQPGDKERRLKEPPPRLGPVGDVGLLSVGVGSGGTSSDPVRMLLRIE